MMFPGGDDINFEDPSWRLGEGSRLVVGVRLLFLDGRVLDSTGFWNRRCRFGSLWKNLFGFFASNLQKSLGLT